MLSEEHLWRVEHALEQRKLDRVGFQAAWTGDSRSSIRPGRGGRFRLRKVGISGSSDLVRIVLQPDELIAWAVGGTGSVVTCLAGNVEVGRPGQSEECWKSLRPGEMLARRKREPTLVRAVALSTVEFRRG